MISKAEAEKLAVIATGLTYLQKQYTKPFEDFGELEAYLQKRASAQIETPNMRNAFWKRMFSREFREKERELYRSEGERRGFQDAQGRFSEAYAAAQKTHGRRRTSTWNKTIAKLNDVIQEKQANTPDLARLLQPGAQGVERPPEAARVRTGPDQAGDRGGEALRRVMECRTGRWVKCRLRRTLTADR